MEEHWDMWHISDTFFDHLVHANQQLNATELPQLTVMKQKNHPAEPTLRIVRKI